MHAPARPRTLAVFLVVGLLAVSCGGTPGTTTQPTQGGGATTAPATGGAPTDGAGPTGGAGTGGVTMISSQLVPVAEAEKMQNNILANFEGEVTFVGAEPGPFNDQIRAQEEAGTGDISLIGGLHGEFATFAAEGLLMDLSDVAGELADVNAEYMELGMLGGDEQMYVPWMQNSYIMAARQEAMEYLPEGADINALTWEQVSEWGAAIAEGEGEKKLGFPAGTDGLWHRFFQGFAYPSFTGALNTEFAGEEAVDMWTWLADTWETSVNEQSTTYAFMQEPLQSGDVWLAWDHAARLIEALRADDTMVAFPAPAGPAGRGFMPVLAGLAIPNSAPNPDGAKDLIRYLLQPETQATTLSEVAFFPVVTTELPGELEPGTLAEQEAITAMTSAEDALPSLLPIGLGEQGAAYNKVFRDAFQQIVLDGGDPATVLAERLPDLQATLDTSGAACWAPDPPSDGVCQAQ